MSYILASIAVSLLLIVMPVLLITILIMWVLKKSLKRIGLILAVCVGSIILLTILSVITNPITWCEHSYSLISEVAPTCLEDGEKVYSCESCKDEQTEKITKLEHTMQDTEKGSRCSVCGYEETIEVEKSREEKVVEETYIEGVSFDEIYRAYKENELRADDTYKNNRYRISAKVNGMSTSGLFNLTGGATLTMEKRVGNTRVFFYAEFEKEQEDNLKLINVGDTITFEGECLSAGSWVNCELIME